jgi:hypothetical protein
MNLMCRDHKTATEAYRTGWDRVFGGVERCPRCDRFKMKTGKLCKSCAHIELVECGERDHGDFNCNGCE